MLQSQFRLIFALGRMQLMLDTMPKRCPQHIQHYTLQSDMKPPSWHGFLHQHPAYTRVTGQQSAMYDPVLVVVHRADNDDDGGSGDKSPSPITPNRQILRWVVKHTAHICALTKCTYNRTIVLYKWINGEIETECGCVSHFNK